MNYRESPEYIRMCCIWIKQVIKHTQENDIIVIIYNDLFMGEVYEYSKQYKNIHWVKRSSADISMIKSCPLFYHFNIHFKLFNLCKIKEPFICLDSDMFVLKDLNFLYDFNEKPFIAVNHQNIPEHTSKIPFKFLNGGLQIVNDPSFLNFENILNAFLQTGANEYVPGHEQRVLFNYFKNIKYDYTHPKVNYEWNSCAKYVKIEKRDGEWLGYSTLKSFEHPVYINHYWCGYKPWKVNCPIYNEEVL
jgi:hypothetical protein